MGIRDHGYYGFAFVGCRPTQIITLIAVIGLVGNFISEISRAKQKAPSELIVTLVISCISLLWSIFSVTAYDDDHLPYFITSGVDFAFLVPFIVIAALLGQPLSVTTCSDLPKVRPTTETTFLALPLGSQVNYILFANADQSTCYELMAVWGLLIALCVLFAISAVAMAFLFIGKRRALAAANPPPNPELARSDSEIEMAPPAKDFSDADSFRSSPIMVLPGPPHTFSGPPPRRPNDSPRFD